MILSSTINADWLDIEDKELTIDEKINIDLEKRIASQRLEDMKNSTKKNRVDVPKQYGIGLYNILKRAKGTKNYIDDDTPLKVNVTIRFDRVKEEAPNSSLEATIDEDGKSIVTSNGKKLSEKDIEVLNRDIERYSQEFRAKKKRNITKALKTFKLKNPIFNENKSFDKSLREGEDTFEVTLKKGDILKFVEDNGDKIVDISLIPTAYGAIAGAMIDTKVDPYAIDYSNRKGSGIGIYMSELHCPNESHISNYTRINGTTNSHSELSSAIIRDVSPSSYIYCKGQVNPWIPTSSERLGSGGHPSVLVESYSFSYFYDANGNYNSNGTHTQRYAVADKYWDKEVLEHDMVVVVSAGNDHDHNIASPAKGFNVITVGNYNDATDTIASSSCFGNPETGIEKPEVVAPGEGITAKGDGTNGQTNTNNGTSFSAPHVSGFVADLLGAYSWLQKRPSYLKAFLLASSTKSISGGVDKVGVGGIDFYNAYYNGTSIWWRGSFSYHASHDGGSSNSILEKNVYLSSGRDIRMAISWLNSGKHTLDHRTDPHPIGKNYNLVVYSPSGSYIAGSWSQDNSYETVNFHTNTSGNYKVRIYQSADRDSDTRFDLGLSTQW